MFTAEQRGVFLDIEPGAEKFFRRCIGADAFTVQPTDSQAPPYGRAKNQKLPNSANRFK